MGGCSREELVWCVSMEYERMAEHLPVGMEKLGDENDGSERLPMLRLGIIIVGGARLMIMLGIVIDGSARLIELSEGGARLIELRDGGCEGMTNELTDGSARLIELSDGGREGIRNELSEGSAGLNELKEGGCEGITIELIGGGSKLIVDGIVIDGSAMLKELSEGRAVLNESDPIDNDSSLVDVFKDETPARISLRPMLEGRVGIERKPVGSIDDCEGIVMDGIVRLGMVTLGLAIYQEKQSKLTTR